MSVEVSTAGGVAEVVIDFPPVNALPVRGWQDLAAAVAAAGADPETRVVILAARGRGFCAGVDIKEMQRTAGNDALLGANHVDTLAGAGQVQLEGEPLLVPVGPLDVHRVDAVQRLLGRPDDQRVLGRDPAGHRAGRIS